MAAAANMPNLKSGRLVHISELHSWEPDQVHGNAVRILGRVRAVNVQSGSIVIEYHNKQLEIDGMLLGNPGQYRLGHMFQFLGELERRNEKLVLKARLSRKMHGINCDLYDRCLSIRRKFEDAVIVPQESNPQ